MRFRLALCVLVFLIPATSALSGSQVCERDASSGVVSIAFLTNEIELRRAGEQIHFRTDNNEPFEQCDDATVHNTEWIKAIDNRVDFAELSVDLSAGRLVPGRTPEAQGKSEIEIKVRGENRHEGALNLNLEGSPRSDLLAVGTRGAVWNRDADLDIHTAPGSLGHVKLYGDHGADKVDAHGGGVVGPGFTSGPVFDLFASGGKGSDHVVGSPAFDFLVGGDGRDRVVGKEGPDWVRGGDGPDDLSGSQGNDDLRAFRGDDRVDGDAGSDDLEGARGDDLLDGDEGDDGCIGGRGQDRLRSCERHGP